MGNTNTCKDSASRVRFKPATGIRLPVVNNVRSVRNVMDKEKRNARQARYRQQQSRSRLELMITPELLERFRTLPGLDDCTNAQKLEALCDAWEKQKAEIPASKDPGPAFEKAPEVSSPEAQEELPILAAIAQQDNKPSADNLAFAEEITARLLVMNPLKNFKINWDEEKKKKDIGPLLKKLEDLYGPKFTDAMTSGRVKFRPIDLPSFINPDEPKRREAILKLLEKKQGRSKPE